MQPTEFIWRWWTSSRRLVGWTSDSAVHSLTINEKEKKLYIEIQYNSLFFGWSNYIKLVSWTVLTHHESEFKVEITNEVSIKYSFVFSLCSTNEDNKKRKRNWSQDAKTLNFTWIRLFSRLGSLNYNGFFPLGNFVNA